MRAVPRLIEDLVTSVGSRPVVNVALLTRRPKPVVAAQVGELLGATAVHPVAFHRDQAELHTRLMLLGPLDVIVDLADGDAAARLAALAYHVRADGVWVAHVPTGSAGDDLLDLLRDVSTLRRRGVEPPVRGAPADERSNAERNRAALAASLSEVRAVDDFVAVRISVDALAKTRADQFEVVGPSVDPRSIEVARAPSMSHTPRGEIEANTEVCAPSRSGRPPDLLAFLVHDVECWPQQVAFKDHLLLPDSFNRPGRRRLRSAGQTDWADLFALRPGGVRPAPLAGTYFYLDNLFQPHFGHAMTEQLSKLWAWPAAQEQFPDLQALVLDARGHLDEWQYDLFAAAGVQRDQVTVVPGPVTVERLVSTTQGFSRPDYIHPVLMDLYERVGRTLASQVTGEAWPDRVFLSRRGSQRACRNLTEVEDFHRARGFEVLYPEDHTLAVQVRLVREASVISGFAGSGMFQICLAGGPKRVVAIAPDTYPAHNEVMFSSLIGHRLSILWCDADISRTDGRFSVESFHSDFELDFARHGEFLDRRIS